MKVYLNEVIVNSQTKERYRILWINQNNQWAYIIDLDDNKALPYLKSINEIVEAIIEESVYKVKDSLAVVTSGEDSQGSLKIRDEAWNIIKEVVNLEPDIFISRKRGKLVQEIIVKHNTNKPKIYRHLRRYWQRGKSPNSLLPDYKNSGGKGKPKQGLIKNGRPPKFKELESNVVVNEEIKKIFRVSLQKYYFNQKKNSLPHAYKMMIRNFFMQDSYYENGIEKYILKDKSEIPTLNQLRYFLNTEYTEKQKVIPRISKIKYEQNFRELLGSSTFESFGPGSRYQIDATVADVYVISEYNSDWIVGRPIIYFVVDVFSRMIVGLYVGLEGPSWMGAMMALANTVADKESFCKEYEIEISKEDWPSEYLPQVLLADRGEFEGYNVERLTNAFNMQVENAAPYRPDSKGIVEKYFNVFQARVKPFLPGYVEKDFQERGVRDYRLDAKLTIKDFTKIMIAEVIYHNNYHYLQNYPRDKEMIEDKISPIPIELWNWGIKNRSGKLTYHTSDEVILHLLPQEVATVTERGIRFKKMHYNSKRAMKESWFSTARIKGTWKVKIAYDPRDMSKIYLLNKNDPFEVCNLLEHEKRYMNMSYDNITYLLESEKFESKSYEHKQIKEEINLISQIESIVASSVKKADELQNHNLSNKARVSSISTHRDNEKMQLREKEKFEINSTQENEKKEKKNEFAESNFNKKSIKEILNKNKL